MLLLNMLLYRGCYCTREIIILYNMSLHRLYDAGLHKQCICLVNILFFLFIAELYQQFVGEILIAETMHIRHTVADKVVGGRVIKFAQCVLVRQARLLRKEFDNAGVFHL